MAKKRRFSITLVQNPLLRVEHSDRQMTFVEGFLDVLYFLPLQSFFELGSAATPQYLICFAAMFNSWLGEAFYNTRFDTEDIVSRAMTLLTMLGVVGISRGITQSADGLSGQTFALSYAFVRTLLVLKYLRAWYSIPKSRKLLGLFVAGFSLALSLWLVAAFVEGRAKYALAVAALLVDYATPFLLLPYMVSVHPSHMPERFAAITVLCGAGNLMALSGAPHAPAVGDVTDWSAAAIGVWLLSIAMPALFLMLYEPQIGLRTRGFNASPAVKLRAYGYLYLHLPLTAAITAASLSLATVRCTHHGGGRCALGAGMARQLSTALGVAHLALAAIHLLSAAANRRRCAMRLVCGTVLLLLPLCWREVPFTPCLGVAVCLCLLQVVADYTRYMDAHGGDGGGGGGGDEVARYLSPSSQSQLGTSGLISEQQSMTPASPLLAIAGERGGTGGRSLSRNNATYGALRSPSQTLDL